MDSLAIVQLPGNNITLRPSSWLRVALFMVINMRRFGECNWILSGSTSGHSRRTTAKEDCTPEEMSSPGPRSKTAEDGDGNVGKTIKLITQDKKRTWIRLITQDKKHTWISAIKLTFVPSNETSTALFPRCLQNMTDISRTNVHRFVEKETLESTVKIETYSVTKVKMCLVKYEDYEEIFFLPPEVGVAVLVCLGAYWFHNNGKHDLRLRENNEQREPNVRLNRDKTN